MSAVPDVVNVAATLCQCQRRHKNVVRVTLRATMRNDKLNLNATWDIFREEWWAIQASLGTRKRVCKDRAPQPGGRFVSSVRAARSVIHVESGFEWGS